MSKLLIRLKELEVQRGSLTLSMAVATVEFGRHAK
jgi:hypothetical protein